MAAPARIYMRLRRRNERASHDAVRRKAARAAPREGRLQKQMAASLGVSAAYLSALEHGRRGVPSWAMVQKIIGYFNVIWDDAEELQRLAADFRSARRHRHGRAVGQRDRARQSAGAAHCIARRDEDQQC